MAVGIDAVLNRSPDPTEVLYDWIIDENGDMKSADSLETAILVSWFTDRRAPPELVPVPQHRRGWVGELETPEDPPGSLLWTLDQSRLTSTVREQARSFAEAALQWMIKAAIATGVSARTIVETTGLTLATDITRPNSRSESEYVSLWDQTTGDE